VRRCKADERAAAEACVPCAAGYANEGGDDPAGGGATDCDGDGTGGLA
jgi:hypothetical protein